MNHPYVLLETGKLKPKTTYFHPEQCPEVVHLDSPAIDVMTDFKIRPPQTASSDTTIHQALEEMKLTKTRSLLVVDKEDHIIGLITARDIQGIKAGMVARENDITMPEVTVAMMMIPYDKLPALNIKTLSNARVGHIRRLIHELGVNYIMVVEDSKEGNEMVRGYFSISRISRQLGENLSGDLSSHSIADINKRLT
ncbi:MAG: CBS domain-containing protein [Gammaproteobacteria bacterium]|nr:CBS domain-containing protein [Gammaproteobacteria bacterium]